MALNPSFSHCQMIPLDHVNIPAWLFPQSNFFSRDPFWLKSEESGSKTFLSGIIPYAKCAIESNA